MSSQKIKFRDKEIDKKKLCSSKKAILLDSVDLSKIVVSSRWKLNDTTYKYFCGYLNNYSCKKVEPTTGKEKVKYFFQTKKDFTTCSKLIINELGLCPTKSDNVYCANNEQTSLAVFTAAFCFAHGKHNLIKLKLCNN